MIISYRVLHGHRIGNESRVIPIVIQQNKAWLGVVVQPKNNMHSSLWSFSSPPSPLARFRASKMFNLSAIVDKNGAEMKKKKRKKKRWKRLKSRQSTGLHRLEWQFCCSYIFKTVCAIWLSTLQNIWSNKICHWFTAISGGFFLWYIICNWDNPPPSQNSSEILQVERLSRRWCTKGKQRWYQETEKGEFRPDASESHTTSQAWYAAGSMPLSGGRGRVRRGREGGGQSTARTCCSVAL